MPEKPAGWKQVGGEDAEAGFGRHCTRYAWHDELGSWLKSKTKLECIKLEAYKIEHLRLRLDFNRKWRKG